MSKITPKNRVSSKPERQSKKTTSSNKGKVQKSSSSNKKSASPSKVKATTSKVAKTNSKTKSKSSVKRSANPKSSAKTQSVPKNTRSKKASPEIIEETENIENKGIPNHIKIAAFIISPLLCGLIFFLMSGKSTVSSVNQDSEDEFFEEEFDTSKSGVQRYKNIKDAPKDGILYQDRNNGEILDIQYLDKEYRTRFTKNPEFFRKIN